LPSSTPLVTINRGKTAPPLRQKPALRAVNRARG
jgi:hypothetical protein